MLKEMTFVVEELPDGGFTACCEGECVFTEADNLEHLYKQVREAVCCHCDENECPESIKLKFVPSGREEIITA